MGNRFDAKHAFAFGIDLQGQLATVQLEDRQIIRRRFGAKPDKKIVDRSSGEP